MNGKKIYRMNRPIGPSDAFAGNGRPLFRIGTGSCLAFMLYLLIGCSSSDNAAVSVGLCNASTGLREPLPACTAERPCTRVAPELGLMSITNPTDTPSCASPVWDERRTDTVLGCTRYACIRRHPNATSGSKRPLVVWFHPGGNGSADLAETETSLVAKGDTYDLSGDPLRPGFSVVSVQGRNLRFPTAGPRDGRHHDF